MINSFDDKTDDQRFASIDEALTQLRLWLEELRRSAAGSDTPGQDATTEGRDLDAE